MLIGLPKQDCDTVHAAPGIDLIFQSPILSDIMNRVIQPSIIQHGPEKFLIGPLFPELGANQARCPMPDHALDSITLVWQTRLPLRQVRINFDYPG